MKGASIKEVQTHVKRVFLDECHNALSYVRQRALLSEPACCGMESEVFFLQFDLGFFGHFVGG